MVLNNIYVKYAFVIFYAKYWPECDENVGQIILLLNMLRRTERIPSTTTNYISLVNTRYIFRSYWPSSGIKYFIFSTQNKLHFVELSQYSQILYECIFLVLNITYLMPDDSQRWPEHVACANETNKTCCGWEYKFVNSEYDGP
jgi:hypothetical protein